MEPKLRAGSSRRIPSSRSGLSFPFAAGGATDILARAIGQKLTEVFGQPVIVDDRQGAGGNIGTDMAAKAAPDGYTLVMGGVGPNAINAALYPKLPYDPVNDFAPVVHVANVTNVLVVHPSLPAKSVAELIALARARPGKLTHASSSPGSAGHLAGEMMKIMARIDVVTVNYKGSGPALIDLIWARSTSCSTTCPRACPTSGAANCERSR